MALICVIWGCVLRASNSAGINQEGLLPGASGPGDNLLEWFLERCLPTRHPSLTSAEEMTLLCVMFNTIFQKMSDIKAKGLRRWTEQRGH